MNLLVTDSVLIDPMFEGAVRQYDNLDDYAFSSDVRNDGYDAEWDDLVTGIATLRR